MEKIFFIGLAALCFLLIPDGIELNAQNPGEQCDPGRSAGRSARIVSAEGEIEITGRDGKSVTTADGSVIPAGSVIRTGSEGMLRLALEDGTGDRLSRLRVEPGSQVVLTGGLYCSDLRPKLDEGRWSASEINFELKSGAVMIEIAEKVSHSFKLEVKTPNSVARMVRASQHKMAAEIRTGSLSHRKKIPVIEHPRVKEHLTAMLMGRSIEELNPRDRSAIVSQAAISAFSLGLIDIEETGILSNPQIQSTMERMTRGRALEELEKNERDMVAQAIAGMAVNQGILDPVSLMVYDQPDESTSISVKSGKMMVYNSHRGWSRGEAVEIEAGKFTEVRGYDIPARPADLTN